MKCPKCGADQPDGRADCVACGVIFSRYQARPAPPPKTFISTGGIAGDYEVVDPVFVLHHLAVPAFRTVTIPEVMAAAAEDLKAAAQQRGADGVIWAQFSVSTATIAVIDVFAYGTAVKLKR